MYCLTINYRLAYLNFHALQKCFYSHLITIANGAMPKKVWLFILLISSLYSPISAQERQYAWVDSVLSQMNLDDKVHQLILMKLDLANSSESQVNSYIRKNRYAGFIIENAHPVKQVSFATKLLEESKIPAFIGFQSGPSVWLEMDSLIALPATDLLLASNNKLLFERQAELQASRLKLLGFNFSLHQAGSLSLNQPFLADNWSESLQKSKIIKDVLEQNGVSTFITKFPIPPISNTQQTSSADSLLRFVKNNFSGIQLSPEAFGLSKKTLLPLPDRKTDASSTRFRSGYKGLLISSPVSELDLTAFKKSGDAEKSIFLNGYDLIVDPVNPSAAVRSIKRSIRKNKQELALLDERVKRILTVKYQSDLHVSQPLLTDNLLTKLNTSELKVHSQEVTEAAVTLLKDEKNILPYKIIDEKRFASISFGRRENTLFTKYLSKYTHFDHFLGRLLGDTVNLTSKLTNYDVLIVGLFSSQLEDEQIRWIESLSAVIEVIVCYFGEKEQLHRLSKLPHLIYAYTPDEQMQQAVPQIIFGALPAQGKLAASIQPFKKGEGIQRDDIKRLSYGIPEAVGMDSRTLNKINWIIEESIAREATPGAHVLVAKNGKVIFEKSYGYQSYDRKIPVTDETIYDLASVTKVAATTQLMMFLHERGELDVDKKVAVYLPELKKTNKKDITIKDILTHQAGLWPFLPFWQQTIKNANPMPSYYRFHPDDNFNFSVAPKLFTSMAMKDSLWNWVVKSKMRDKIPRIPYDYRYSDMGMYILHKMAEKLVNQNMEDFLSQNFYAPLGCYTTGYLPLQRFRPEQIAPTEDDKTFRKQLLIGTVHDQGAAMHGGVAGHAGLFSNANDLAKLGQMLLNKGEYGGLKYFKKETVEMFTAKQFENSRRGIGWDKSAIGDWNTPTSIYASPETFGHTGFTGIGFWMDPEFDLMYIFFSNRVHPDMNNNKLLQDNVRTRVHDVVYESIFNHTKYQTSNTWSTLK
jgi:beta-N-acetylhexosaminidase